MNKREYKKKLRLLEIEYQEISNASLKFDLLKKTLEFGNYDCNKQTIFK